MLQFLLFSCCCIAFSLAHNINIKVGPILKTHTAASYFGFSATGVVIGEKPWLAVGSPRANSTKLKENVAKDTGAFFKCPITMSSTDCEDKTHRTDKLGGRNPSYDPTNGWYGVSVAGGRKEDNNVMVCSHRPLVEFIRVANTGSTITMPGFCVVFDKNNDPTYEDNVAIIIANVQDFNGGRVLSFQRSRFAETGIGAAVQGSTCYSGAVGDLTWQGSIAEGEEKHQATDKRFSYGGYSLATGSFFAPGSKDFAIGAPRYDVTGAVLLKDSLESGARIVTIKGEQYGSYFGMAVCAGDFDGDNIFEVVVGAPYYTDSISVPSIGKVYVYSSKNDFSSPVRTFKAPEPQAHALFGKAVAVIGDLDLSGDNDLVIGSPYQGDGGAVYIYHGSANGLSEDYVQMIKASDFPNSLKTFGWSVRGETDLDSNGYPDIVVGAYASDSAMILRSVPVVDVRIQYKLSSETIDVSNKSCTVNDPVLGKTIQTVCFDVKVDASYMDRAGKMTQDIAMSFELDADTLLTDTKKKRVRFESSQSPHLKIENKDIAKGNLTKVTVAKAYLRVDQCPDCEDKINPYPDIQLQVWPKIPKRDDPSTAPTSGEPPSLQPYFTLPYLDAKNAVVKNVTKTEIKVKRSCDPCKPDLFIKNNGTTKIPVQASDITLEIEVGNKADQAFEVRLIVDLPPPLRVRPCAEEKCLSICEITNNASKMNCELGNFLKTTKKYLIRLDTSKASNSLETYVVTMNVTSANEEDPSLLGDNYLSLPLKVASEADIGIKSKSDPTGRFFGGSIRGQFSMTSQEQIGLKVNHVYSVYNNGPNLVPEVNITIEWPYQAANGKRLLYLLNITGADIDNGKAKCFPKNDWVNPLASQFIDDSRRVRRNIDERDSAAPGETTDQVRKGSASKVTLDCANKTAMCLFIRCTLLKIEKNTKVEITMESRIWNSTLLEDYTDSDVQVVSRGRIDNLTSYVTDDNINNHEFKTITSFYPDSPKTIKKDIATWIIIVSAIAGVVLLIILVVVFKICGFFNRSGGQRYDAVPEN